MSTQHCNGHNRLLSQLAATMISLSMAFGQESSTPPQRNDPPMAQLNIRADAEELQVAPQIGDEAVARLEVNGDEVKTGDHRNVRAGDTVAMFGAAGAPLAYFLVTRGQSPAPAIQAGNTSQVVSVPGNYKSASFGNLGAATSAGTRLEPVARTESDAAFLGHISDQEAGHPIQVTAADRVSGQMYGQASYPAVAVLGAETRPALTRPNTPVDLFLRAQGDSKSPLLIHVNLPPGVVFTDGSSTKTFVKTVAELSSPIARVKSIEPVLPGQERTYSIPVASRVLRQEGGIARAGAWSQGLVRAGQPTMEGYLPNSRGYSGLRAAIDGQPAAPATFDRENGAFVVVPNQALTPGAHQVRLEGQRNGQWIPLATLAATAVTESVVLASSHASNTTTVQDGKKRNDPQCDCKVTAARITLDSDDPRYDTGAIIRWLQGKGTVTVKKSAKKKLAPKWENVEAKASYFLERNTAEEGKDPKWERVNKEETALPKEAIEVWMGAPDEEECKEGTLDFDTPGKLTLDLYKTDPHAGNRLGAGERLNITVHVRGTFQCEGCGEKRAEAEFKLYLERNLDKDGKAMDPLYKVSEPKSEDKDKKKGRK